MKILLVSAVRFEAQDILSACENLGREIEYFEVGIGPIHAAKREESLAREAKGKHVIYIGSCGGFYDFTSPHLVSVEKVLWMPPCLRTGLAQEPEGLHKPFEIPSEIKTFDLPQKTLLTSPTVSLKDDILESLRLPPASELVENMELYSCVGGILSSAKKFDVVLGVTNQVGPNGRLQWRENFRKVAKMTSDFVIGQLQ